MRTFVMRFKDPVLLNSMLHLRRQGWTYKSLAVFFNVDHSSIYSACKIRGVRRPKNPLSIDISGIISVIGVRIQQPKSYRDYLIDDRYRGFPNLRKVHQTVS